MNLQVSRQQCRKRTVLELKIHWHSLSDKLAAVGALSKARTHARKASAHVRKAACTTMLPAYLPFAPRCACMHWSGHSAPRRGVPQTTGVQELNRVTFIGAPPLTITASGFMCPPSSETRQWQRHLFGCHKSICPQWMSCQIKMWGGWHVAQFVADSLQCTLHSTHS